MSVKTKLFLSIDGNSAPLSGGAVVYLPHPRNNVECIFLVTGDKENSKHIKVFEIQEFNRRIGVCSAFIGDTVLSNASLNGATLFDPIFFVMKIMFALQKKIDKQFIQLSQLLSFIPEYYGILNNEIPSYVANLQSLCSTEAFIERAKQLCSSSQFMMDDWILYLSEEKAVEVIYDKIDRTLQIVAPNGGDQACNEAFDMPEFTFCLAATAGEKQTASVEMNMLKKHILEIFAPMCPEGVVSQIKTKLKIVDISVSSSGNDRRTKDGLEEFTEEKTKKEEVKKVESKAERDARLHGEVKGVKSIMSFFAKKA